MTLTLTCTHLTRPFDCALHLTTITTSAHCLLQLVCLESSQNFSALTTSSSLFRLSLRPRTTRLVALTLDYILRLNIRPRIDMSAPIAQSTARANRILLAADKQLLRVNGIDSRRLCRLFGAPPQRRQRIAQPACHYPRHTITRLCTSLPLRHDQQVFDPLLAQSVQTMDLSRHMSSNRSTNSSLSVSSQDTVFYVVCSLRVVAIIECGTVS